MDRNDYRDLGFIPFNRPFMIGDELKYIAEAISDGMLARSGKFSARCADWIETNLKVKKAMLTNSCTAALELSALLLDIGPGDEVIIPSFTFAATANAFAIRGAGLRFIDIRPDTLNLDETKLPELINSKTRAIAPVHYAGVGCEMDAIMQIAGDAGIAVVEDAAHAVCATYKGRPLGSFGRIGCLSFHETKNLISGEGGALLINDESLIERAQTIGEHGTNRKAFDRGEVDKYTWVEIGSSFFPSELVAAFLYAQLENHQAIIRKRLDIHSHYYRELKPLEEKGLLSLPKWPEYCEHNGHMFYLLTESAEQRQALLKHLNGKGVRAVFHYAPLHLSKVGQKFGAFPGELPVTESVAERLVRLPIYFELGPESLQVIIEAVRSFY